MDRDHFNDMPMMTDSAPEYQLVNGLLQAIERLLAALVEIERLKKREYLTAEEVELVYGLKATTLANKRMKAMGPEYVKDGEKILYKQQAVKNYLSKRTVKTVD